jgi:hypothetical protein
VLGTVRTGPGLTQADADRRRRLVGASAETLDMYGSARTTQDVMYHAYQAKSGLLIRGFGVQVPGGARLIKP